jgi:hypothetical protein
MTLRYLFDENTDPALVAELRRRESGLIIRKIGEPGTLPRGTLDPAILLWCEQHNFVLVTNNRSSMPEHLLDHLREGRHVPGIFQLNPGMRMGETIDLLALAAQVSLPGEHADLIRYLPNL